MVDHVRYGIRLPSVFQDLSTYNLSDRPVDRFDRLTSYDTICSLHQIWADPIHPRSNTFHVDFLLVDKFRLTLYLLTHLSDSVTLISSPPSHGELLGIHLINLRSSPALRLWHIEVSPDDSDEHTAPEDERRFSSEVSGIGGGDLRHSEGRDDSGGVRPECRPCHCWFSEGRGW